MTTQTIETRVPARLDRLPWSRFHWLVVIGLGTVWILDGLEVTLVGSIASRLTEHGSGIHISTGQIGVAAAVYVAGACCGALFFGQLTDRFGRKKLFLLTLGLYLLATGATAFAFAPWYFFVARFFTGAGIGGEYAAINSAIDELIPARVRGRVDLIINGSYWVGSAAGSAAALFFLDTSIFAKDVGWRIAFGMGVVLGLTILLVRRNVPESPRWLFIHGREEEAERIVSAIEADVREETGDELPEPEDAIRVRQRERIPFRTIARTALKSYPKRTVLGFLLFVGQAFIYNGVTFNLGTLFTTFYGVSSSVVPVFIVIFAVGNFLGPLCLGRLFDTVGRKPMISGTYLGSAAFAVLLAFLFVGGTLGKWWFELLIVVTFFLASAGASAAYLTVSEIFPMETRALAIAFFYAIGTAVGGITGPLLFGHLIGSGDRGQVIIAFLIGAGVMAIGGIAELLFGVKAEQAKLEDIAKPLTAEDAESTEAPEAPEPGVDERRRAAEERARAAEHRANLHVLRGDEERLRAEEALAAAAELRAAAAEERAGVSECTAEGDELRARAHEERACAHEHRLASLFAADGEEGEREELLAVAAQERSRALEQRARGRASGDGDEIARAHRGVADAWAQLHDERAQAAECRARGEDAAEHDERAAECEVLALAAGEHARAAEARREAAELGDDGRDGEREVRAADRERRLRERLERRRQGLRRFRPGPGDGGTWASPGMALPRTSSAGAEAALEREVAAIARALDEHGATERGELRRLLAARYWGPGRFGAALQEAVELGRVRRLSRTTFAPAGEHDNGAGARRD